MMILLPVVILCSIFHAEADIASLPNVNATFGHSPQPFEINVDRDFIEDTRQRVANSRAPIFIRANSEGPSNENFTTVRDYWANEYDWNMVEASINKR
jgi:hypothetical protein